MLLSCGSVAVNTDRLSMRVFTPIAVHNAWPMSRYKHFAQILSPRKAFVKDFQAKRRYHAGALNVQSPSTRFQPKRRSDKLKPNSWVVIPYHPVSGTVSLVRIHGDVYRRHLVSLSTLTSNP